MLTCSLLYSHKLSEFLIADLSPCRANVSNVISQSLHLLIIIYLIVEYKQTVKCQCSNGLIYCLNVCSMNISILFGSFKMKTLSFLLFQNIVCFFIMLKSELKFRIQFLKMKNKLMCPIL